jgi:hypothetical protein
MWMGDPPSIEPFNLLRYSASAHSKCKGNAGSKQAPLQLTAPARDQGQLSKICWMKNLDEGG